MDVEKTKFNDVAEKICNNRLPANEMVIFIRKTYEKLSRAKKSMHFLEMHFPWMQTGSKSNRIQIEHSQQHGEHWIGQLNPLIWPTVWNWIKTMWNDPSKN